MTSPHLVNDQMQQALKIVGCYAEEGGIELVGPKAALSTFSELIESESLPIQITLYVPKNISPKPYDLFLTNVQILDTDNAVVVNREGSSLIISGSADNLSMLANSIFQLVDRDNVPGNIQPHSHIEYYEGHFYLDSTALPLVVISIAEEEPDTWLVKHSSGSEG